MAQIRQFVPKKDDTDNRVEFEKKIKKHRRSRFIKIAVSVIAVTAIVLCVYTYVKNLVYTSYSQVNSVDRTSASESTCLDYNGRILTYSKDGISSMDAKGNVIWNETYQMQRPIVRINENSVAVGDYNGNVIYVMDENGKKGEVDTNLPIRDFCVSATGIVAAVLEDTNVTRLSVYSSNGKELIKSECRMDQTGYPIAVALSDSGEVMAVSYLLPDNLGDFP